MWWFFYDPKKGQLQLSLEVGPIADPAVRHRLLNGIKDAGFSFWEKGAFRDEALYTRILSATKKLRTGDDGEPDEEPAHVWELADELWRKGWGEGSKIVGVLRDFAWPESA